MESLCPGRDLAMGPKPGSRPRPLHRLPGTKDRARFWTVGRRRHRPERNAAIHRHRPGPRQLYVVRDGMGPSRKRKQGIEHRGPLRQDTTRASQKPKARLALNIDGPPARRSHWTLGVSVVGLPSNHNGEQLANFQTETPNTLPNYV